MSRNSKDIVKEEVRLPQVDRRMPKNIFAIPFWAFLRIYKIFLSPLMNLLPGAGCRFYPTCSDYAITAIYRHGVFKGLILAVCRLLRCQPFCEGGIDYVPDKFEWKKLFRRNTELSRNSIDEESKSDK